MKTNLRNGLKWRNLRPRWEPSPANRKLGISGRDLKDLSGRWITDRGRAISMADARLLWATLYREAQGHDARALEAREDLRAALDDLTTPTDDEARLMRQNVADLIEKARAYLEARPEVPHGRSNQRLVTDLIAGYLAKPPKDRSAATLKVYETQAKKFEARFGNTPIAELTTGTLRRWYEDLCDETSLHTAYSIMATAGAMLRWAVYEDWITSSPATRLGLKKPKGRLVMWSPAIERAFVSWCDANAYEDVADAITFGCWTGARQIDMVAATVGELEAQTWRFTPTKTHRGGREALPGILPIVHGRVARRRASIGRPMTPPKDGRRSAYATPPIYLNPDQAPFLYNPVTGRAHSSKSIGDAFGYARQAAARAVARGDAPDLEGIDGLRLQDTRDTCVTRLFLAGIPFDKIPPWTGHSYKSAQNILMEHYRVLLEEEAIETARQFQAYAETQGFKIEA